MYQEVVQETTYQGTSQTTDSTNTREQQRSRQQVSANFSKSGLETEPQPTGVALGT